MTVSLYLDNQATARIIQGGKAPTLRRIKMHLVCVTWLHERMGSKDVQLEDCNTEVMAADILTKHFINSAKWLHACLLIGVVKRSSWLGLLLQGLSP